MAIKIAGRLFTGPMPIATTTVRRNHNPAVYVVISKAGQSWNPTFRVIDVGETAGADLSFAEHPRLSDWEKTKDGELGIYILSLRKDEPRSDADRAAMVEDIRRLYDPPNGFISVAG
jgi:hypothetical protein